MKTKILVLIAAFSMTGSAFATTLTFEPGCAATRSLTQVTPVNVGGTNYTFDFQLLSVADYIANHGFDFTDQAEALAAGNALVSILNANDVSTAGIFPNDQDRILIPYALSGSFLTSIIVDRVDNPNNIWAVTGEGHSSTAIRALVSPVPIPAAAYLFLTGLAGMFGLKRYKAKAAA